MDSSQCVSSFTQERGSKRDTHRERERLMKERPRERDQVKGRERVFMRNREEQFDYAKILKCHNPNIFSAHDISQAYWQVIIKNIVIHLNLPYRYAIIHLCMLLFVTLMVLAFIIAETERYAESSNCVPLFLPAPSHHCYYSKQSWGPCVLCCFQHIF